VQGQRRPRRPPAKRRKPQVSRLTREETARFLAASNDRRRDRWLAHLGCCAGLRSQELRGVQGRHFARPGFIWVTQDLGKGLKERWVPVIADLEPVVVEILTLVALDEFVLPGQRSARHPTPEIMRDVDKRVSASAIYKQTVALGERAGIAVRVTPHVMRRSFATHVARHAGVRVAQSLLGHESITTTEEYTNAPTLDELAVSLHGISFYQSPMQAPTRRKPRIMTTARDNERNGGEQSLSGLPLALTIHEGGDQDSFVALPTVSGDTLILELDDGRTIEVDRKEILDRAAA
jgi:hypothetical protein